MKLKVSIDCDNEAFDTDGYEAARILRDAADRVSRGMVADVIPLRDINGNTVGKLTISTAR